MGVRSRPASAKVRSLIMCGIFAYLNHLTPKTRAEVIDLLIKGLKRLEYRGYDSAGIGIDGPNGNASITLLKSTGKVKSLEDKIEAQMGNPWSSIGSELSPASIWGRERVCCCAQWNHHKLQGHQNVPGIQGLPV